MSIVVDGLDPQEQQLLDGLRIGDEGFGQSPPGRLVDGTGDRPQPLAAGDRGRAREGEYRSLW